MLQTEQYSPWTTWYAATAAQSFVVFIHGFLALTATAFGINQDSEWFADRLGRKGGGGEKKRKGKGDH